MYGVGQAQLKIFVVMRKESIIVVYDNCQATAEEIADKLGGEPVNVQSLNQRMVNSARNLILGITIQDDGQLTPSWAYGKQLLTSENLQGKTIAVFVSGGKENVEDENLNKLFHSLKQCGAHLAGDVFRPGTSQWNMDYWIASISPNL